MIVIDIAHLLKMEKLNWDLEESLTFARQAINPMRGNGAPKLDY
jgi:hypothetical protein